jgi:hypothetical protein
VPLVSLQAHYFLLLYAAHRLGDISSTPYPSIPHFLCFPFSLEDFISFHVFKYHLSLKGPNLLSHPALSCELEAYVSLLFSVWFVETEYIYVPVLECYFPQEIVSLLNREQGDSSLSISSYIMSSCSTHSTIRLHLCLLLSLHLHCYMFSSLGHCNRHLNDLSVYTLVSFSLFSR